MPDADHEGLSAAEVRAMRSVEDELWWYRVLRAHVLDSIEAPRADFDLLDAGCGTGGMLARIHERFPQANLTGIDVSLEGLQLTRERDTGAQLVRASTNALPFPVENFDVALSLDVLAFRGVDDRAAIREIYRVLRPRGSAIINLPAFDFLRGSHDVAVNQPRRYTRPRLRALLRDAGFARMRLTYWNMLLTPAVAAVRLTSRSRATKTDVRSDLAPVWPPLNALLTTIARSELAINQRVPLPFGTSLFALAHK
ncbi:MAG: methyltransferase domain-containing protein [Chthoniobacterales bacterium]